jgi:hypothetical protein
MPDALDRTAYELAFDEDFTDSALDPECSCTSMRTSRPGGSRTAS